jgi:hypothetical protein
MTLDDRTQWVLDFIVDLFPPDSTFEEVLAIKMIDEAIATLEGRSGLSLFGLSSAAIDESRKGEVLALLHDAKRAWRDRRDVI